MSLFTIIVLVALIFVLIIGSLIWVCYDANKKTKEAVKNYGKH